jgi:phospholipase C
MSTVEQTHSRRIFLRCLSFGFVLIAFAAASPAQAPREVRQPTRIASSNLPAPGQIQHVVFIMKENRSFDHYFGQFPGADGVTSGYISDGQQIPLWRAPDVMFHDGDHNYDSALTAKDGGKMDQFDLSNWGNVNGDFQAYSQMTQADIPNYWAYAQNFVLSDHTFESETSPSYNAHFYSIAASGEETVTVPFLGNKNLASWGCDALPGVLVTVFDSAGVYSDTYPCFNLPTLADSLNNASPQLSWKFYAPPYPVGGYEHSAFDYVQHIRDSSYWNTNVVNNAQFVTDALAGNLPTVSWIIADTPATEHPPNSTCVGENWTVQQINAVMQGPADQWNSTVIFVTWDEWGGFYDHMDPPVVDQWGYGLRVPMLIISPYSYQPGYITHTTYEFSSVLKFIEENFNLPFLTDRDANANDTSDSFNFNQNPQPPLVLNERSCPVVNTTVRNWSDVPLTKSVKLPITVNNWGNTAMTIGTLNTTGNYKVTSGGTCGSSLAAGSSCTIDVAFSPKAAGVQTGVLTVNDSGPNSPQTVNLTGVGTAINLPVHYPGLSFSQTFLGSTAQQSVQLSNTSTSAVTLDQIQTIGDYSQTNNCGSSLAAGSSCQITVTFAPTTSGYRQGNLVIWDNDPGSPQMGRLTGTATAIARTPYTLTFSGAVGQTSAAQTITVTNNSSLPVTLESVTVLAPFNQTNNCAPQIPAASECTINVTFSPQKQGDFKATLYINDSDFMSPQEVYLTGNGSSSSVTH